MPDKPVTSYNCSGKQRKDVTYGVFDKTCFINPMQKGGERQHAYQMSRITGGMYPVYSSTFSLLSDPQAALSPLLSLLGEIWPTTESSGKLYKEVKSSVPSVTVLKKCLWHNKIPIWKYNRYHVILRIEDTLKTEFNTGLPVR